jgi:phage-related minor tail protein
MQSRPHTLLPSLALLILSIVVVPVLAISTEVTDEKAVTMGEAETSAGEITPQSTWDKTREVSGDAWDATKTGSAKAWETTREVSGDIWDVTKEGSARAWETTREVTSDAWDATKEGSARAWDRTRELTQSDAEVEATPESSQPGPQNP